MGKRVAESRAERRSVRSKMGALHDLQVGAKTLARYAAAVSAYEAWRVAENWPEPQDAVEADKLSCGSKAPQRGMQLTLYPGYSTFARSCVEACR
jgi:hypothetical protein